MNCTAQFRVNSNVYVGIKFDMNNSVTVLKVHMYLANTQLEQNVSKSQNCL